MKTVFATLAAFATLLASSPTLAQWQGNHPMGWGATEWGWGHMIFGGFMMIAFWGGLIVVIILLIRWLSGAGHPRSEPFPQPRTPLHILQERFARGEIDKDEYEERRRLLSE